MDYVTTCPSPIGMLYLRSDGCSLTGLSPESGGIPVEDLPVFALTRQWLDAYFRGDDPDPAGLPLAPGGTPFQRAVWAQLLTIPRGCSRSYGQIARAIGKPGASQAVGQAVGQNPIGIIIPCHRVLGADGALTGFAWGLEKKKWLLCHEGVDFIDHS